MGEDDRVMSVKKLITKCILILLCSPLLGALLLFVVHLLPTGPMFQNLYWSETAIRQEIENEVQVEGYSASLSGSFTDCLMLEHAIYDNPAHSAFSQAMHMYRAESFYDENDPTAWWPGVSLLDYLNGVPAGREVEYSRYWHGYLVVLKPLLMITSLSSIRLFNAAAELMLLGLTLILISRRVDEKLALAFVASVPFMYFFGMYFSLSLSICFYLTTISMIVMLMLGEILEKDHRYILFFLTLGVVTAYFDFLTYPLVVLGFPLTLYGYMHFKKQKRDFLKVFAFSGCWGLGYGFMWGSKWVITDVAFGDDIIRNAVMTIFTRTASAGGNRLLGLLWVVKNNISPFMNWGYVLFGILLLLILAELLVHNRKKIHMKNIHYFPVFLLIALMPVAWFFLAENHSAEHWMFTCKIFSVSVFAVLAGIAKIFETNKKSKSTELPG